MRLLSALILGVPLLAQVSAPLQDRADRFLKVVNAGYQSLTYVNQQAVWNAASNVSPANDVAAEWAGKAYAAFNGNPALITEAMELLMQRSQLKDVTARQLERVLLNAAEGPMTRIPAKLAEAGMQLNHLYPVPPTLEDVFIHLLETEGEGYGEPSPAA